MNKEIVSYTVASASDSYRMGKRVRELIKEGWQLYGSPSVSTSLQVTKYGSATNDMYIQAMVKYAENE